MELRVWIGSVQRVISGVSLDTTSQQVIVALAQAAGKTGRFTLVEKWRDYEKTLTPNECPLTVAQKYGDYAHEVQFILRQTGEATKNHRRLAEAKSPKPQKRRAGIKKSISFSGGAQTSGPSRSPKLFTFEPSIAEDEGHSDSSYVTPQPRQTVPQPHPADEAAQAMKSTADSQDSSYAEQSTDSQLPSEPKEPKTSTSSKSSTSAEHRHERSKRHKSRERSVERRESRSRSERARHQKEREAEIKLRETVELQQAIATYERRLEDEKKKLLNTDRDISSVSTEEEKKWIDLYRYRENVSKAVLLLDDLDNELEDFDEVLLSEELNVLLRRRQEMNEEMSQLQEQIEECDSHINTRHDQSNLLLKELEDIAGRNEHLELVLDENAEEMSKLMKRVEEKKRFLVEAEHGYMSACDDLKEADLSLEKRKQMLVELERELREYNLKTFINTGFSDKYANSAENRALHMSEVNSSKGLLV